ncbi:putative glycosyltransferase [Rivularia sp. PCC 7116]|uniref:glycosyltransferase family 2 protein n=1 Tax=Rivularia sp. PCC 7116 TaxID=373994 RepID=UPI00029F087C|nr:glycosyltransferase [Rivularia sp. PCC 7116]AFY55430.1 putative glycosyltransferase [Rivularia sp. PCC 7116]
MPEKKVTIVVVPRERFQFAKESLESLYQNTNYPFDLVYVDNNSPTKLRRYLETQSKEKGFQIVRSHHYLSPNAARNLGLRQVTTEYVVFVDNDVVFSHGWLKPLVNCTEDTGATVVGSLVCQYKPVHEILHCAGGEYMQADEFAKFLRGESAVSQTLENQGKWRINEKTPFQNQRIVDVADKLKRQPTGFIEFHSILVRREVFSKIGMLDESLMCTKEYIDFAMSVTKAGGEIYLEPASIVTFLTHPPAPALKWQDLPYFMLRWSDAWELENLQHFRKKWDLVENEYFIRRCTTKLGKRRYEEIVKPVVKGFSFLPKPLRKSLEKKLVAWEKKLNRYLSNRHSRLTNSYSNMNTDINSPIQAYNLSNQKGN